MELTVYKINGEKTDRTVNLDESIFGVSPNDHAIYLDVKQILANKRQGTHKAKERGEVAGSTRKIKRQKGTGTARAGDIKNPIFRGGGRTFGPRPRDYSFKLNKKLKRLARKSALSYKAAENKITVIEDFTFETPKTKNFVEVMKSFELTGTKTLLVMRGTDQNVYLSARNVEEVLYLNSKSINTYDVMKAKQILIVESSLEDINDMFRN
nr:50S ribosomal protein L4 [Bacteroidota bacterium]